MEKVKIYSLSFLFVFLFILPNTLSIFLSETQTKIYFYTLLLCYGIYFCLHAREILAKPYLPILFLTTVFVVFGTFNLILKSSTETFNIAGPIITYLAYHYLQKNKMKSNVMDFLMIGLYIYYFIVYYMTLPDLLIHPEYEDFFIKASSNAIPITLNITLYIYMILNRFFDQTNNKRIVLFATINLVLIVIQQSRAGIIIALVILLLASYDYSKKIAFGILMVVGLTMAYLVIFHLQDVLEYMDIIGDIDPNSLKNDSRGDAQSQFFMSMDIKSAFFGYSKDADFGSLKYTYNVFLDIWNRYGIIPLIIVVSTFIYRIIFYKSYKFPLYFFAPFLIYSLVESQFFPNFWDVVVYAMLFTPKEMNSSHFIVRNNKVCEA